MRNDDESSGECCLRKGTDIKIPSRMSFGWGYISDFQANYEGYAM